MESRLPVRVLGEYKSHRNMDALAEIADTSPTHWKLEIIGRGWPNVLGWSIRNEFVTEDELSSLIENSSVIVVPYRKFFQSGIAFRSVELGTPVVGPMVSSMQQILGSNLEGLMVATDRPGDWSRAVAQAIKTPRSSILGRAAQLSTEARQLWHDYLTM